MLVDALFRHKRSEFSQISVSENHHTRRCMASFQHAIGHISPPYRCSHEAYPNYFGIRNNNTCTQKKKYFVETSATQGIFLELLGYFRLQTIS